MATSERNDGKIERTYVVEFGRGQRAGDGTGQQFKVAEYAGDGPNGNAPIMKRYLSGDEFVEFMRAAQQMFGWNNYRILWVTR